MVINFYCLETLECKRQYIYIPLPVPLGENPDLRKGGSQTETGEAVKDPLQKSGDLTPLTNLVHGGNE